MILDAQQVMDLQFWIALLMIIILSNLIVINNYKITINQAPFRKTMLIFLFMVTAIACVNYFYVSRTPGSYIHRWDIYHTYMGAKYYEELGYDRLYECSIYFDSQYINFYEDLTRVRDLNTLQYIDASEIKNNSDCELLFTQDRKEEFIEDLKFFNSLTYPQYWNRLFRDKGYNGSPFYTFIVSNIFNNIKLGYNNLIILSMIDILLIFTAFYFVYRAFGIWVALFALIFFCVNFPARFVHMGGSILRFDYLAYLIIGVCLFKLEKYKSSGVFLALSSMLKIFPVLFVAGLGLKAFSDVLTKRKIDKKYLSFFSIFFVAIIIFFILSISIGQGMDNWYNFFENMEMHNQQTAGFRVGFMHMFMFSGEITEEDPWTSYAEKQNMFEDRIGYFYISIAIVVLLLITLMPFMKDEDFMIIFGTALFFFIFASTRYYYALLVLLFLLQAKCNKVIMMMLFTFTAISLWVYSFNKFDAFIYNYFVSFLLLLFFITTLFCLLINNRENINKYISVIKQKISL